MSNNYDPFEPLPIPFVRASWIRCDAKGLSQDVVSLTKAAPVQKLDESLTDLQSVPVGLISILHLITVFSHKNWCIAGICDSDGICVELLCTNSAKACADKFNLRKGIIIDESSAGTCAPSLSVLLRNPCAINAESHYLKSFRSFHSMAVPILNQSVSHIYSLFVFAKYHDPIAKDSVSPYLFAKCLLNKIWQSTQEADNISRLVAKLNVLTNREKQVLCFLLMGCKSSEIQKALNINKFTVRDHCRNIYKKLGKKNRVELLSLIKT
jgi:DNA-binding CsgD family transcriptional regulator